MPRGLPVAASAMRPNPPQAIRERAENLFTHRGDGHQMTSRERERHIGRALWPGGLPMAVLPASAMRPNPPQAIRGNAENLFTHRGDGHQMASRERERHIGRALWPGGLPMAALTASAMRPNPPQAIRGNTENLFTHRGNGHQMASRER